jgi:hypothetical protein
MRKGVESSKTTSSAPSACPIEEVCYSKTYKTKLVCSVPECKELHIEWLNHVLQLLLCKNKAGVGNVNVVCKCEG